METPVTAIVPVTLDEILFEHRNKDYGAYELRKTYTSTVNRAMWIGITAFSALFITSYIFAHQKEDDKTLIAHEYILQNFEEPDQPPVEKIPEPEPPKPIEQKQTIRYVAPEVVNNPEVEVVPPTPEEMEKSIISNVTTPGEETEGIAETPPPVAPPVETKIAEVEDENKEFLSVEVSPSFMGGVNEMYKFLGKTLKYPSAAQRQNVEGRVYMSFVVEKDGSITDVHVMKGIGFGCDEEATRAVKLMPKWIAGKQNGRNVRVRFTIPVSFKLDQ
ncbi:energy transducer TonB [Emticicia fontis]